VLLLGAFLRHRPALILACDWTDPGEAASAGPEATAAVEACTDAIRDRLRDDNVMVKSDAAGLLSPLAAAAAPGAGDVMMAVCELFADPAADVREAALAAVKAVAKRVLPTDPAAVAACPPQMGVLLKTHFPNTAVAVFRCAAREKNSAVKYATERTLAYLLGVHHTGPGDAAPIISARAAAYSKAFARSPSADVDAAKETATFTDYAKRVASKLITDSDDEIEGVSDV